MLLIMGNSMTTQFRLMMMDKRVLEGKKSLSRQRMYIYLALPIDIRYIY
jgi:hypothetical protein